MYRNLKKKQIKVVNNNLLKLKKLKKSLKFNKVLTKKLVRAVNTMRLNVNKIALIINKKLISEPTLSINVDRLKYITL